MKIQIICFAWRFKKRKIMHDMNEEKEKDLSLSPCLWLCVCLWSWFLYSSVGPTNFNKLKFATSLVPCIFLVQASHTLVFCCQLLEALSSLLFIYTKRRHLFTRRASFAIRGVKKNSKNPSEISAFVSGKNRILSVFEIKRILFVSESGVSESEIKYI